MPNAPDMPKRMDADELSEILDTLRWPGSTLATALGLDESTVRRWLKRATPIPDRVAAWLRPLAAFHKRHPPPMAPERPIRPGRPPGGSVYGSPTTYRRRTKPAA
jgi:hypothetical protein